MPLYEYQCPKCGNFELIQKFSDDPLRKCPTCGSDVQKLLSAPAIQFKGTGWYITDYARKSEGKGKAAAGDGGGDGGKAEGGKAEGGKDSGSKDSGAKDSGAKDSGGKASSGSSKGTGGSTSG